MPYAVIDTAHLTAAWYVKAYTYTDTQAIDCPSPKWTPQRWCIIERRTSLGWREHRVAGEAFWRGSEDKEREEVGGGQGWRKGCKIGGIERGLREKDECRASKERRLPLLPPSVILAAFEVDRRPVFTPVFRLPPSLWTPHKVPGVQDVGSGYCVMDAVGWLGPYSMLLCYCNLAKPTCCPCQTSL